MGIPQNVRLYVDFAPWQLAYRLYICADIDGRPALGTLTFTELREGKQFPHETARFSEIEAQGLVDSFWQSGIRASQGKQSEGVNGAQGRHLEDMRAIVFSKLNITAPGA